MLSKKSLTRLVVAGFFVLAFTFGLRSLASGPTSAPDYDGKDRGSEVIISVDKGDTGSIIGRKLADADVVQSAESFFRVAVADPRSNRIAPGDHRLERKIPAKIALDQLLDPKRVVNLIVVRDGAWVNEISLEMEKIGFGKQDIAQALSKVSPPAGFNSRSIEGFLYPAFYSVSKGSTAVDVLNEMVARFSFSTQGIQWDSMKGFTKDQILTIASLIETEGTPDVHKKVSRVIYNRLSQGMPLQLDSTIHYILQRRGEIRVSLNDTKVASRYNTFSRTGLPPGPIGSPTRASIEAALSPEPGDWLYFVTVRPGETKFTARYDEFLQFKAEYKKNLAAGLFK